MLVRIITIFIGFWLPNFVMASDCFYDEDLVAGNQIVTDEDIVQSTWLAVDGGPYGHDTDKVLYMTYENGDIVTISHRYCQMYEFEATIMWVERPSSDEVDRITGRLTNLFNEHSALDADAEPIGPFIKKALSSIPLDSDSPVFQGMPEVIRIRDNINVEAHVRVDSYSTHLPGVKYMTTLYVGFGGMH